MPVDAADVGRLDVLGDPRLVHVASEVVVEPVDVEVELGGVPDEVGRCEVLLVVEQQVVHLPELALGGRGFGGLRGQLRGRVHVGAAAGVATRTAGRCRASSSRTTGSAWPQYGHSKSPNSMTVIDASARPADVVAVGVDLGDQVLDQADGRRAAPGPVAAGDSSPVSR